MTSILQPTPDIIYLSKIPDWKVLTWGIRKHQAIGGETFFPLKKQQLLLTYTDRTIVVIAKWIFDVYLFIHFFIFLVNSVMANNSENQGHMTSPYPNIYLKYNMF